MLTQHLHKLNFMQVHTIDKLLRSSHNVYKSSLVIQGLNFLQAKISSYTVK